MRLDDLASLRSQRSFFWGILRPSLSAPPPRRNPTLSGYTLPARSFSRSNPTLSGYTLPARSFSRSNPTLSGYTFPACPFSRSNPTLSGYTLPALLPPL